MKAIKNGATAVIFDISEVPQAIKQVYFPQNYHICFLYAPYFNRRKEHTTDINKVR